MEQDRCIKTRRRMREFFIKNWKNITLGILGVIFVYLIVRVFTPTPDTSELNKYKLEQIDKHIEDYHESPKAIIISDIWKDTLSKAGITTVFNSIPVIYSKSIKEVLVV